MKQDRTVFIILAIAIIMLIAQLTKNYMLFAYMMPTMIFAFIFLGSFSKGKLPKVLSIGWVVMYFVVLGSLLTMLKIVQAPEDITAELIFGLAKPTFILLAIYWAFTGIAMTAFYSLRFEKDILPEEVLNEYTEIVKK